MRFIYLISLSTLFLVFMSCGATQTTVKKHGGDFSNVRANILMHNEESAFGYATLNVSTGDRNLTLWVPGERKERIIKLDDIISITIEEQVFEVRWLSNPSASRRQGNPRLVQAVVERLSEAQDVIEVFEYKYKVRNPKSTIGTTQTAYFVSFPSDERQVPMCELGSTCYREKWSALVANQAPDAGISMKPPATVKHLLAQLEKFPDSIKGNRLGLSVGN